jgi:hypothetical protein
MASNGNGNSKEGSLNSLLNDANASSTALKLIKRFLYQALGIYLPAVILILYFLFFWSGGSYQVITNYLPDLVTSNQTFSLILLLISVFIIGEAINSLASNITTISPMKLSLRDNFKYLILRSQMSIWSANNQPLSLSRRPNWPVWMNETYFPVSFAIFDRFYLTTLDAEKKALAGKIGWVAFYRNLVAIFVIIIVLQFVTITSKDINGQKVIEAITIKSIYSLNTSDIIFIGLLFVLIIAFYRGYKAQINANKNILWNAYRRNELRKTLEARYGDLALSLGIKNDYKKVAEDYILDRWFLAAEHTIRDISGGILNKAEIAYKIESKKEHERVKRQVENQRKNTSQNIRDSLEAKYNQYYQSYNPNSNQNVISRCRDHLRKASKYWHDGDYEMVIDRAFTMLEDLRMLKDPVADRLDPSDNKNNTDEIVKLSAFPHIEIKYHPQKGRKEKEESPSSLFQEEYWKSIKGLYLFMDMFYASATYKEIRKNVTKWGWVYESKNNHSASDDNSEGNLAQEYSSLNGPKLSEAFDQFSTASFRIREVIETINQLRRNGDDTVKVNRRLLTYKEEEVLFKILDYIYIQFGGYNFLEAQDAAQKLFNYLEVYKANSKNSTRELTDYIRVNMPEISKEFEDCLSSDVKYVVNKSVVMPAIRSFKL